MLRTKTPKAVGIVTVAALVSALLTLVAPSSASATVAFSDGFESGNLSSWTASNGLVVQQQEVFAGTYAARGTSTAGTAAYAYKTLPAPLSELTYDGRFKFISSANNNVSMVRFRTAAAGPVFSMLRRGDGSLLYYNEVTGVTVIGPVISSGWHQLVVPTIISGTASTIGVSLDGVAVGSITKTDSLGTTPIGRVYVGEPATGRTFDLALDAIVVSDSGTPTDAIPPSTPGSFTATAASATRVDLTWTGSTDNVGVTGYSVFRNGSLLTTLDSGARSYSDTTASPATTYGFSVDAFDAAGNHSTPTSVINVTTPGTGGTQTLFNDGFESGNLSQWSQVVGVAAQQSQVYAGNWAARATTTGTTAAFAQRSLTTARADVTYDGKIKVLSQTSTTASLVRLRTLSGGSILSVLRNASSNKLSVWNEVTGITTTLTAQLSTGAWHDLMVHASVNGGSGLVEMWLDGAPILSKTDDLGTTGVGRLYFGDPSVGRSFDIAFDDQQVSTASSGGGGSDMTPPSTPTNVVASAIGPHRVNLTWTASTDNVGVVGYTVSRDGGVLGTSGPKALAWVDATVTGANTYSYTVEALDAAGNRSAVSTAASDTTPPGSVGDPVIATAGDIACDPVDSNYNHGVGNSNGCVQRATSDLIFNSPNVSTVLPLGDNQYANGTLTQFNTSFDPTWGRLRSILRPVPGNHEYQTTGGAGYYAYFGSLADDPSKGYYSYNIGAWHIVALNGECGSVGGCGSGSTQERFLAADLAANPAACTLAYWHEPRFSSGAGGDKTAYAAFWTDLYNRGAEIVLAGHDHNYERFAPQDPNRVATANGIREFVVGTGGEEHTGTSARKPNSQVFTNTVFGVLQLTLHANSYDWQFLSTPSTPFTDTGTGTCH